MSVLPKTNVTWTQLVLTPRDLTTAPVKMDFMATGKTARVRLYLRARQQRSNRGGPDRIEILAVNFNFFVFRILIIVFVLLFSNQSLSVN